MDISRLKSNIGYSTINTTDSYTKNLRIPTQTKNLKRDTLEISHSRGLNMGMMLDKGTAAHTTVYVNYATFRQIASYTTNNQECPWSEMGIDGEKRWIVVNGQRFECPLSKEEKEAIKRASRTILDFLEEYEKTKENLPSQRKENKEVEIDFNKDKTKVTNESNSKIDDLLNNEKVANMLRDISKSSEGRIYLSV